MAEQEHKVIWLEPWCDGCDKIACGSEGGGRQWCQDDVWDDCTECGAKSVKYTIAAVSTPGDRDAS